MCRLYPLLPGCVPVDSVSIFRNLYSGWLFWASPYPHYHDAEGQASVLLPLGACGIPFAPHWASAAAGCCRIAIGIGIGIRRVWFQSTGYNADHVGNREQIYGGRALEVGRSRELEQLGQLGRMRQVGGTILGGELGRQVGWMVGGFGNCVNNGVLDTVDQEAVPGCQSGDGFDR